MAKKREVAELSGNFRGELSSLDEGEGIRLVFALCAKIRNTRSACDEARQERRSRVHVENQGIRTPCTSIAKTVQKIRRNKNERITENQNQA